MISHNLRGYIKWVIHHLKFIFGRLHEIVYGLPKSIYKPYIVESIYDDKLSDYKEIMKRRHNFNKYNPIQDMENVDDRLHARIERIKAGKQRSILDDSNVKESPELDEIMKAQINYELRRRGL